MEEKLIREIIILINYWCLLVSIVWYVIKCIRVKKDTRYFRLKTYKKDYFEMEKRGSGSYMVVIKEVYERKKNKVVNNGAETTFVMTIKEKQMVIFRLTQTSGCNKERIEVSYNDENLRIYYAPLPQEEVNEYKVYQVILKEL